MSLASVADSWSRRDKQEKRAATKVHKIEARKLLASEESLFVCTDGSMRPQRIGSGELARAQWASEGALVTSGGTRVLPQKIGPGSHAEGYDAEMVGLRWGLQGALRFVDSHPNTKHTHASSPTTPLH